MTISIDPATPDRWEMLEELFGPDGACHGCWCTHMLLTPKERRTMPHAHKRRMLGDSLAGTPAPGLLAVEDGEAVGWVRVTPRAAVPGWNSERTVSRPLDGEDADDSAVWAISCFFIRSRRRGEGMSRLLTEAAVVFARGNGAHTVDACPMRQAKRSKSVGLCVGSVSVFDKAGFRTVAERKEGRPLMRLELR